MGKVEFWIKLVNFWVDFGWDCVKSNDNKLPSFQGILPRDHLDNPGTEGVRGI